MRFFGRVGYGEPTENPPGVWTDTITEKSYYGDVIQQSRHLRQGENLSPDLSVQVIISIVADTFAMENRLKIRYAEWTDILWTVTSVSIQSPRLELTLGEVYNGPTP